MSDKWSLYEMDNGTMWLTDGVDGISCEAAFRLYNMLKSLAKVSGRVSINDGSLLLPDGSAYDLRRAIDDAELPRRKEVCDD